MGPGLCTLAGGLLAWISGATEYEVRGFAPKVLTVSARPDLTAPCTGRNAVAGVPGTDVTIHVVTPEELRILYVETNNLSDFRNAVDLAAFYSLDERAIYLPDTFDLADVGSQSDLLHELVHHVQHRSGALTDVYAAEAEAYRAQIRFLRERGRNDLADLVMIMMLLKSTDPASVAY